MIAPRAAFAGLFVVGVAVGTLADAPASRAPLLRGDYQVLAVDLHVHTFMGDGALWPWDLALEARRRGLDAIAITNHNQVMVAKIGHWVSAWTGGSMMLVGEEVTAPGYHLIAVGIEKKISSRQTAARAIVEIHDQGGVAIAAHPLGLFWPAYDDAALRQLDGAEVMHPVVFSRKKAVQLQRFFRHAESIKNGLAAIGSSDYHILNGLGICRTYVFVREKTEAGILDAVRAGRTVVYSTRGDAYGDPALIDLLKDVAPDLGPRDYMRVPAASPLEWITRAGALLSLFGLVFFGSRSKAPVAAAAPNAPA